MRSGGAGGGGLLPWCVWRRRCGGFWRSFGCLVPVDGAVVAAGRRPARRQGRAGDADFPFPASSGRTEILGAVEDALMPAAESFDPIWC